MGVGTMTSKVTEHVQLGLFELETKSRPTTVIPSTHIAVADYVGIWVGCGSTLLAKDSLLPMTIPSCPSSTRDLMSFAAAAAAAAAAAMKPGVIKYGPPLGWVEAEARPTTVTHSCRRYSQ